VLRCGYRERVRVLQRALEGLATTYSPASWDAVPSALRVFTAEFGMGSGVHPSPQPPGRRRAAAVRVSCGAVERLRGFAAARDARSVIKLARAIRTAWLSMSPYVHLRPIDVMVCHGSRGDLVLRRVSRLDAFSVYPVRT
jgi:hypothetical protein